MEEGSAALPAPTNMDGKPLVVLVVGMAGTGKTTFVHRMQHYCVERHISSYFVNLDPAVNDVPFEASIDIRDTVNYKEVMRQYTLGPNGAIMTSLNLFAMKFHQVISILEKKQGLRYIFVDTPGQIEVFTWSASGQLIIDALAATFPTCVAFVGDITRCVSPQTFMSTMLYSCSILYKSQVPLLLVLNKADVASGDFLEQWMTQPDALGEELRNAKGYAATLTQSLSLFAQDYYRNLHTSRVSAMSGEGIELFEAGLEEARARYISDYLPIVHERLVRKQADDAKRADEQMRRLRADLAADKGRRAPGDDA